MVNRQKLVINASSGQSQLVDLTSAELAQAAADLVVSQANDALTAQQQNDATTLRNLVLPIAQSAVGVQLTALTANQRNALIAALLWNAGALNPDGTIKPLNQWINR